MKYIQSLLSRQSQTTTVAALEQLLAIASKPNAFLILWRWRYEMALVVGILVLVAGTVQRVGVPAAITLIAAAIVALLAAMLMSPGLRRLMRAHVWRIITPHRIRVACRQARITGRDRKLPIIVLTRRKHFGERVLIWCRAGMALPDFTNAQEILVTACWAADVQIKVHPRYAHLVTLDVVRNHPPIQPAWASVVEPTTRSVRARPLPAVAAYGGRPSRASIA